MAPELASYSASKFAVRGLTEALDLEWRPHKISVRALWPLFVDTAMIAGVETSSTESLGAHLTPREVAGAAWRALHRTSPIPKVQYPVGGQTKVLYYLSGLLPAWTKRAINEFVAK